jgi:hypothetical protein
MWHGVDPLRVQMIRNQLNPRRINAVRFLKQKSCRTLVALCRASTSWPQIKEDVDGRDVCAKTRFALWPGHDGSIDGERAGRDGAPDAVIARSEATKQSSPDSRLWIASLRSQ